MTHNNTTHTAMILAAGLGSRLKPWTNHHPKALAIVNGKSLLQRNIEYLQLYGITQVVVNVHHFAQQIIDAVQANNGWGSTITISNELNEVLETGGGLLYAQKHLAHSNQFVLMNCDILTTLNLQHMLTTHNHTKALATIAIAQRNSSRQLLFNNNLNLVGWANTATNEIKLTGHNHLAPHEQPQQFAFSGIHVIDSNIFNLLTLTGKFSMIDAYLSLCNTQLIQGYNHSNDIVLDVGKPEAIAQAELLFA